MTSQTKYIIVLGLIVFGIGVYVLFARDRGPARVLPATVNRDCAPWDGPAFTIFIPYQARIFVTISIWQEPELQLPERFLFPDKALRQGSAVLLTGDDRWTELTGTVFLWGAEQGQPVKGWFDLTSDEGQHLTGKFTAEWGTLAVYCA